MPAFDIQYLPAPRLGVFRFGPHQAAIQLPKDYRDDSNAHYPLIVFLTGHGGSHIDNNFTDVDFSRFRQLAWLNGVIVVCGDYSVERWMNPRAEAMTVELLDFVETHLPIDRNRISMMGVSMGGGGTVTFASHHRDRLNRVCNLMGMTNMATFAEENDGRYRELIAASYGGLAGEIPNVYRDRSAIHHLEVLKTLPMLVIHGQTDAVVSIRNSETLVDQLRTAGGKVEYIAVNGVGHENRIVLGLEEKILDFLRAD
jgi:dipeptidyl aminopeptidase/acylaminoacyl peptidase